MKDNTKQSEETYIRWSIKGNPLDFGDLTPETILTIHPDGRVTTSDKLKPDKTAALVLDQIKIQWMKDSQALKIKQLQTTIKELEEVNEYLRDKIEKLEYRRLDK